MSGRIWEDEIGVEFYICPICFSFYESEEDGCLLCTGVKMDEEEEEKGG